MKITNTSGGPKVINAEGGARIIADGESVDDIILSDGEHAAAHGTGWFDMPAPTGAKAAANEAPDYERDNLGEADLSKANKDTLLVIAAYEKAEVPEGDEATKAQIVSAIEAARKAKA